MAGFLSAAGGGISDGDAQDDRAATPPVKGASGPGRTAMARRVRRSTGFDWPAGPRAARFGRLRRALGAFAAAAIALALVGSAALWLRLSEGPIDLERLRPWALAAAEAELGPGRLTVRRLSLALGEPGRPAPRLRLDGVALRDAAGAPLASAAAARVGFRPLDLLRGRLRPSSVTVEGARARVERGADGRLSLALGAGDGDADAAASDDDAAFQRLVAALVEEDGPLSGLERVALPNLRVAWADGSGRRASFAADAELSLRRDGGVLTADAALTAAHGARATARARRGPGGAAELRLTVAGLRPAAFADRFPDLPALRAVETALRAEADVALEPDGRLRSAAARIEAGPGFVRGAGPRGADLPFDAARVDLAFDPAGGATEIRRASVSAPGGALSARGVAWTGTRPDGARAATLDLSIDALSLADPALIAAPASFDGGSATLRLSDAAPEVEVAALHLSRGPLRLDARGTAGRGADGWEVAAEASLRDLPAADLVALWPAGSARGARAWLSRNLSAGTVDRADAAVRLGPEGPAVELTFAFRDAAAHYLRPLPPIEAARGWGRLTEGDFALALTAATVTGPDGGAVDLAGSSMRIPDLADPLSTAEVDIAGGGPVPSILGVLDLEPLGFVGKLGLNPADVAGAARATARLRLPLIRDLRLDQIAVTAAAELTGVDLLAPGLDARLTAERMALEADMQRLRLAGDATLAGAAVRLEATETFSPEPGRPRTEARVVGRVSADQAAAIGVDLRPRVSGSAGVDARIESFAGRALRFEAALDLEGAAVDGAPAPWAKPADAPGTARVAGRRDSDGLTLTRVELAAAGLEAEGSLRLRPGGGLAEASFGRLRLDGAADLALDVAAEGEGFRVTGRGALLDLGAFDGDGAAAGDDGPAERPAESPAADPGPPFDAALDVAELRVTDRLGFRDAALAAERDAAGDLLARIDGRLGAGPAAAFVGYADEGGARRLRFASEDAGDALRSLGVFARGIGGRLEADATAQGDGPWTGELRIDELAVSDDPGLAAMLDRAEMAEAVEAMRREGLRFRTVRAPFTLEGDRVRLRDAVAWGPTIGLSVSGEVDTARDALDLEGVFTPAYGVNRLLGDLPVIGPLFSGGEGQGLIAFTFAMTGPSADPQVRVNPFSALLPGALRNLARPQGDDPEGSRRAREAWLERVEQMR
jgi:hypothetical protein